MNKITNETETVVIKPLQATPGARWLPEGCKVPVSDDDKVAMRARYLTDVVMAVFYISIIVLMLLVTGFGQ